MSTGTASQPNLALPRSAHSFSDSSNQIATTLTVPNPPVPKTYKPKSYPKPPALEIFRRLVLLSDGRDKTLKIIQYIAKLYLWLIFAKYRLHSSPNSTLKSRLTALTSNFSTTRKIIRLAHFLEPYNEFRDYLSGANSYPNTTPERLIYYIEFVNTIVGMLNDFFDDLYCLGKIGVFDKSVARRAEPIAIRFWFLNILLDINVDFIKIYLLNTKMRKLETQCTQEEWQKLLDKKYWLNHHLIKLLTDLGFCGYDFFGLDFSDGWQAVTGLTAGLLSFHKLWTRVAEKILE